MTPPTSQAGLTLVEVLMGLVLLVVGIGSVMVASLRCSDLRETTAEHGRARHACRDVIEQLRADLLTTFQARKAQPTSTVGDLQVTVTFPVAVLVQALGGGVPATARFRDLDSDGEVDLDGTSTEVTSLLPVRVAVQHGPLRMTTTALVADR